MLNVDFYGRLGADAESKVSQNGNTFLTMRVAVDGYEKGERVTEWVRVTYIGERASKMKEHLTKGKAIYVHGTAKISLFQSKTGEWVANHDVIADRVDFMTIGSSGQTQQQQAEPSIEVAKPAQPVPASDAGKNLSQAQVQAVSAAVNANTLPPGSESDDDLPF